MPSGVFCDTLPATLAWLPYCHKLEDKEMRLEMLVRWMVVSAVIAMTVFSSSAARATVCWSEDFSAAPDLNSGNWNSSISLTLGDTTTIGTWDTTGTYAASNTSPTGAAAACAATAQYMFDASDKSRFGSLYDSTTGRIGGGGVSGILNVSFAFGIAAEVSPTDSYGYFQLYRGKADTVTAINTGVNNAMKLGKNWGATYYGFGYGATEVNSQLAVAYANHIGRMEITYNANAGDSAKIFVDETQVGTLADAGDLSFDSFMLRCGNQGTNWNYDTVSFQTIPEPCTWMLVVTGLISMVAYALRKRM